MVPHSLSLPKRSSGPICPRPTVAPGGSSPHQLPGPSLWASSALESPLVASCGALSPTATLKAAAETQDSVTADVGGGGSHHRQDTSTKAGWRAGTSVGPSPRPREGGGAPKRMSVGIEPADAPAMGGQGQRAPGAGWGGLGSAGKLRRSRARVMPGAQPGRERFRRSESFPWSWRRPVLGPALRSHVDPPCMRSWASRVSVGENGHPEVHAGLAPWPAG